MRTDMNKIEFNTQICTTVEQSKRLLELGLKPETSDMHYVRKTIDAMGNHIDDDFKEPRYGNVNSKYAKYAVMNFSNYETLPAWSLHRLIEMLPDKIEMISCSMYIGYSVPKFDKNSISYIDMLGCSKVFNEKSTLYDNLIDCIEWLIKDGHFNKELLKGGNK